MHFQQVDVRDGIGNAGDFVLQHEVTRFDNPARARERKDQIAAPGCDGFVSLFDLTLGKQGAVRGSAGGLH